MLWATRRRILVLIVLGALVAASGAILVISATYQTPSCTDGVQNQNETGVDCGGACRYVCTALVAAPTVRYTKTVSNGAGRIDVVASIENTNHDAAARAVPYRLRLYATDGHIVRETTGTIDLLPERTQLLFLPGLASASEMVRTAFLEIAPTSPKWFTLAADAVIAPRISSPTLGGSLNAPRVQATLENLTPTDVTDIPLVVVVRNADGTIMGASSTVVPLLPAQGKATATFTWSGAFPETVTAIEVSPLLALPEGLP